MENLKKSESRKKDRQQMTANVPPPKPPRLHQQQRPQQEEKVDQTPTAATTVMSTNKQSRKKVLHFQSPLKTTINSIANRTNMHTTPMFPSMQVADIVNRPATTIMSRGTPLDKLKDKSLYLPTPKTTAAASRVTAKTKNRLAQGCSSLMYACQQGDTATVLEQLRTKPERIRQRDSRNKSVLHYCAELQQRDLVAAASIAIAAPELLESADEDGFTPLHLAVIQGNLAMVNLLLANKADVNAVDNEGHSVVHWATVCGEVEALRSVLAAGANVTTPDINGGSPLHYAAQMCGANYEGKLGQASSSKLSLEILSILLAHPQSSVDLQDKDGRQPLLWAASAGSAKAVIALVKAGARVESADKDGLTALHCAASRGHTECIDTLISLCGAPTDLIDSNGCTALHYAVTLGHADATSRLLDLEADPNRQDRKGRTPAHCGCSKGQFETVKLLKERGANLWLRNAKGDLPVHEAASSGRRELVEWLLEQRPKQANTTSNDGRSLLHIAAVNDYTDMCKMLLDYGADINAIYRNSKGVVITPLDCALQKAHRSTAKFIQSNGGLPASKLRLSGRRSNPFQDASTEAVRPLKYAEKEEISDLTNSKKYVVYLKRSDSDNGEGSCSCTEQTYKKEHKYSHICSRHRRSRRHSRRRTSSCGEPKAVEHCRGEPCSDICRSKSNIEIRRKSKSRERYASSSGGDGEEDEDSCENCCYHKKQKQRVVKRRSISTRHSKELRDTDDDDEHDADDGKKGGANAAVVAESKREKHEVGVSEKSNATNVTGKKKSTSRPSSKTMADSRPQSATSTKRRTPTPTQTPVGQTGAIKDGTFIKTPPEASPAEVKPKVDEKFAGVDLTDDEEDANAKIASQLVTTLVDVHRSADDTQSTASLTLHDEETKKQQLEVEEKINEKAEATLEERVTEQISKEVDQLLAMAATAVSYDDVAAVEETQQRNENEKAETNGKQKTKENTKESKEKDDKESIAPPHLIQTPATPSPAPTPVSTPTTAPDSNPLPASAVTPTPIKPSPKEDNAKAVATAETTKPAAMPITATAPSQPTASTTAAAASSTFAANTANEADASSIDQQQQQREQESRRSFTLLPSDSGDEEQPTRKSSFQVLKSDESVDLEGEASDRAQNEHYEEEFSDTQVFKIMPETHAEVARSSQDEAEEDEADAHVENDDEDDYEVASVDDDEDIPVAVGGSPLRRFTSSGNRHGVGISSKTPPPTQTHEYDYSTGRKRRLKKRIRSGAKSRSNWNAGSVPGSGDARGSAVQQQSAKDQDSGFEPSPRAMKSKIPTPRNIYTAHIPVRRPIYATLDGRSCSSRMENRKPGDKGACDMAAVTRSIQRNIRRYYMERKIFQHLLELKSLQIRSNKLNEAVLVKRAIDDYHKSCAALGGETGSRLRRYPYTEYTFKNFELFLYETLKTLQKPGTYNFQNIHEVYEEAERRLSPDYNMYAKALQCTTKTHRCLHAAHAYTGIPCAAYIPMMNHHTMPKFGFGPYKKTGVGSFYLPKILSSNSSCGGKVSLELSHGKNKQLISLPSEKLDSNKRYYVTFTVKESQSALETKQQQPPLPHQQQQQQQQQGGGSCADSTTKCSSSGQVNNERK